MRNAAELVACLKRVADFEISVAAFPETHPEALSPEADLDNLKRKFDAGATRAISQFFFDVPVFLRFVEKARKAGIEGEIVPGILPVTNFGQMVNFAKRCGTSVPDWMGGLFEGLDNDPSTRELVAATVAAGPMHLARRLWRQGVPLLHPEPPASDHGGLPAAGPEAAGRGPHAGGGDGLTALLPLPLQSAGEGKAPMQSR